MIRTFWVALNMLLATLVFGPAVIVAAFLGVRGEFYDKAARSWARWILWASGTPVRVEGLERVPLEEPQVFVSNHESWYDVFALAAVIPKRARFIAKRELLDIPVFGVASRACGHIGVDRSDRAAAVASLEHAGELIRRDHSSIVMFPEGTRSPSGRLLPFKKGAFMLALRAGVDLVPVAVLGTRRVLPKGGWRVRSGAIIVRFGAPVRAAGYDLARRDELIAEVRGRMRALIDGPDGDSRYAHSNQPVHGDDREDSGPRDP